MVLVTNHRTLSTHIGLGIYAGIMGGWI